MIGIVFQFASEVVEVRIDKTNIYFRNTNTNGAFATIDNMKLSYNGVIKEHPDLKDNKEWSKEAISRFKEKIKQMKTEKDTANYIISDLSKFGYKPIYAQRQGFRPISLNGKQSI
jgi:GTP1/Obg family GTP-binding protein